VLQRSARLTRAASREVSLESRQDHTECEANSDRQQVQRWPPWTIRACCHALRGADHLQMNQITSPDGPGEACTCTIQSGQLVMPAMCRCSDSRDLLAYVRCAALLCSRKHWYVQSHLLQSEQQGLLAEVSDHLEKHCK
jgi:hypothetical protein